MTSDARTLAPASIEFAGISADGGTDYVVLPKFREQVVARIHAWATGYGDPDHAGSTAFLKLAINGKEIGEVKDSNFTLYDLQIERTVTIPAKTDTKVEIKAGNHLATEAGDPAHGVVVTVEPA